MFYTWVRSILILIYYINSTLLCPVKIMMNRTTIACSTDAIITISIDLEPIAVQQQ